MNMLHLHRLPGHFRFSTVLICILVGVRALWLGTHFTILVDFFVWFSKSYDSAWRDPMGRRDKVSIRTAEYHKVHMAAAGKYEKERDMDAHCNEPFGTFIL